jgi:uncharacterized Zn-binding protein involved in type VI secretion
MKSVASAGEMTSHGTPLSPGPGSINVTGSGKRLWRIGMDFHSCPIADPRAHVGGTILIGSKRVMINNFPVAGQGDLVVELGIVNSVITGNPKLL